MRDAVESDLKTGLTDRMPELRQKLKQGNFFQYLRALREGKRHVAGMDGEEVLFAFKEGDVRLFRFYYLVPGNPASVAQPHTEIQLRLGSVPSGGKSAAESTSPLDEAGAVLLWDTLLNRMRLRPGAM